MAKKKSQPAAPQEAPAANRRRNPPWHRMVLKRLAIHGNLSRAAMESDIHKRQIERRMRASRRYKRAVQVAQQIALQRHSDKIQDTMLTVAEKGLLQPVYYLGKRVAAHRKLIPGFTRYVAEAINPVFRSVADRRITLKRDAQFQNGAAGYPVSSNTTTLNVTIGNASLSLDNPVIRAALWQSPRS